MFCDTTARGLSPRSFLIKRVNCLKYCAPTGPCTCKKKKRKANIICAIQASNDDYLQFYANCARYAQLLIFKYDVRTTNYPKVYENCKTPKPVETYDPLISCAVNVNQTLSSVRPQNQVSLQKYIMMKFTSTIVSDSRSQRHRDQMGAALVIT